ncbi:MAG: glycogen synthase GlgA [Clostridia bacterium]|nr:glycogen synthase GlgA [Clostridia bacterium]
MNVLFCASEATPFAASGGLGDVAGSLPRAIRNRKVACRVVLPLYGDMKPEYREKLTYVTNFTVPVGWRNQYCGLFELTHDGVKYYFLDNEYYFKRTGLYGFYDDGERYAFFSRAILEMLFHIDFAPDIIHTNDWQTALVPVYLNLYYRHLDKFRSIKSVFTIHNIQYQGKYGLEILEDTLAIGRNDSAILEYDGCVNFMKGAIECADKVTTVSPTYAYEILDPWFSHGLDGLLRDKRYKLCGILNGIDVKNYNPATDPNIAANFDEKNFAENKLLCKKDLQQLFGLNEWPVPVVGMVTRLVAHKGLDLVCHVAQDIVNSGMQLAILGSGDSDYERFFSELAARNLGAVGVQIAFKPAVARKVYAGADMFLMPSKSEPCGLSQMVALRYGTVPIVRETGGLKDSIKDSGDGIGNGFTFRSYNAHDMLNACLRAKEGYDHYDGWKELVKRDIQCDFSWGASAKQYVDMYEQVCQLW